MSASQHEFLPPSDETADVYTAPLKRFADNLDNYVADGQKEDVLRPHQQRVFDDVSVFLHEGGARGFIEMPTGTGKTVLFVALAEAFSYNDPNPPKILVVTPTRDLVRQTQGGPSNLKGFGGFAPDMEVGTYYSDSLKTDRGSSAQVTITTYASLRRLAGTHVNNIDNGFVSTRTENVVNNDYDIVFFDEGHRAQGEGTRAIIEDLDPNKMIIGFTATPDYSTERKLESILPTMIHKLDIEESIEMHMLSPVIPLAVNAPGKVEHTFAIGHGFDYEKQSLKELIYDDERNNMIVDMAAQAVAAGNTPIISCIPGDNMAHPQLIAEALSHHTTTDAGGTVIPIKAVAITGKMSGKARQDIYEELEAGNVHALAYIDVLNEGWDSQVANVLINARPTRSLLSARQRVGRILRPKADSRPALAIDIIDSISSQTTPPATIADVLKREIMHSGEPVGEVSPDTIESMSTLIGQLTQKYGYIETLTDDHTKYMEAIVQLPLAKRGIVKVETGGKVTIYATPQRLYKKMHVDGFFIDELKRRGLEPHIARVGSYPVETYEEYAVHREISRLHAAPENGRYHVENGTEFISVEDIVRILHAKYSIESTRQEHVLAELERSDVVSEDLRFTKRQWAQTHAGRKLYKQRLYVSKPVAQSIVTRLRYQP